MANETPGLMPNRGALHVPQWLREARNLLRERCSERVYLAEIARVVDVHPVHLAQTFKRKFGETIGDYTRRLRVRRAAECLTTSDQSIVEIAHACGFYDQSHLTRTFKLHTAMTPAQYRACHSVATACHSDVTRQGIIASALRSAIGTSDLI